MDRSEAILDALKSIDVDDIAEKIAFVAELLDKGIVILSMIAAATPTEADDNVLKVLKAFNRSFGPLITKAAEIIGELDDD